MSKHPLKEIETALRKEIDEIKKIKDPGERLLAFATLKKACEEAYDRSKAVEGEYGTASKADSDAFNGGMWGGLLGGVGGLAGGIAGGVVLGVTGVLTAGLAIPAGLAIFAGVTASGAMSGRALGRFGFNVTHSDDQKHATEMYKMNCEINRAIEKLTSSDIGMEALSASPRVEDVKKAFPELVEEFNRYSALNAGREKLLKTIGQKQSAEKKPGPQL